MHSLVVSLVSKAQTTGNARAVNVRQATKAAQYAAATLARVAVLHIDHIVRAGLFRPLLATGSKSVTSCVCCLKQE